MLSGGTSHDQSNSTPRFDRGVLITCLVHRSTGRDAVKRDHDLIGRRRWDIRDNRGERAVGAIRTRYSDLGPAQQSTMAILNLNTVAAHLGKPQIRDLEGASTGHRVPGMLRRRDLDDQVERFIEAGPTRAAGTDEQDDAHSTQETAVTQGSSTVGDIEGTAGEKIALPQMRGNLAQRRAIARIEFVIAKTLMPSVDPHRSSVPKRRTLLPQAIEWRRLSVSEGY